MWIVYLILVLLIIRSVESYLFIKKVSKLCFEYDWTHVNHNDLLLVEMFKDEDYTKTREWSAYNFLFYKGPSPLQMFFSFKPLTIEKQYKKDVVDRLRKYEII